MIEAGDTDPQVAAVHAVALCARRGKLVASSPVVKSNQWLHVCGAPHAPSREHDE